MKRVLVLGCGAMGRGIVDKLMKDPSIETIYLYDVDSSQTAHLTSLISREQGPMIVPLKFSWGDKKAALSAFNDVDMVLASTPWNATREAIEFALISGKCFVSVTRPRYDEVEQIASRAENSSATVVLGCGLEPGLTEIMARYMGEQIDVLHELHLKCGGIPMKPLPPLGYRPLFGGSALPIAMRGAFAVENGQLRSHRRFSGVENAYIPDIGYVEAWHDGMLPWFLEIPGLSTLQNATQKTLRWPGFAAAITLLWQLGFLNERSVKALNKGISPLEMTQVILQSRFRNAEQPDDVTILQVEARGLCEKGVHPVVKTSQIMARSRPTLSSMALLTGHVCAIVGHVLAMSDGDGRPKGLVRPEQLIYGHKTERLLHELRLEQVEIAFLGRVEHDYSTC